VIRLTCCWVLHAGHMEDGHSKTWEEERGYTTAEPVENKLEM